MKKYKTLITTTLVFLVVFSVGLFLLYNKTNREISENRSLAATFSLTKAHNIHEQLEVSLSSTLALASIIRNHGGMFDDFDALAEDMIRTYGGISFLSLAPKGVVTRIYPLKGNEAGIGHNILKGHKGSTEAMAAIKARTLTLAGPFELDQGGVAVIGRMPVFMNNADTGVEEFWGFTIALIKMEDLLDILDLEVITEGGFQYELFRVNPDTGKKQVFGRSSEAALDDPVFLDFEVPNGRWFLAVKADAGWYSKTDLLYYLFLVLVVSALISALPYMVLSRTEVLNRMVQERTLGLEQAYEQRKRLEGQLLQAQKMEAVGQLAGGVAHDFNNILMGIIGFTYMLKGRLDDSDQKSKAYLEHIITASDHAASLTKNLLSFSRKQKVLLQVIDLNSIVESTEKLLMRVISSDIEVRNRLSSEQLSINADASQVAQVFMNLATNAMDAMPKGGTLTVRTSAMHLNKEFVSRYGLENEGQYALLTVGDSGTGMDDGIISRIFEPFFTTKDTGKGTGLGLSMVYGTVKQHGGFIDVQSDPGIGTVFSVYFPIADATAGERQDDAASAHDTAGATILVAEDNEFVRDLITTVLEESGHSVITAKDGLEAIDLFNEHKDAIDMALLDVIMPKCNGNIVYAKIKEIKPELQVAFISGYDNDLLDLKGLKESDVDFISKPISPADLLGIVNSIIKKV